MFEPIRGGTRGGQAEFKWSDVSADKDREHYLGHSINAPTGRWQKNKDVHWYGRGAKATESERDDEIRKIKEAEADALSIALGFAPTKAKANAIQPTTGSSTAASTAGAAVTSIEDDVARQLEKEERRRRKAERKEEKRARKEARRAAREDRDDRTYRRDRSRSPNRRVLSDDEDRRSRSPSRHHEDRRNRLRDYDEPEREKETASHRRLWDMNSARHRAR